MADDVATYLNNKKRRELSRLEDENHISVQIFGARGFLPSTWSWSATIRRAGR